MSLADDARTWTQAGKQHVWCEAVLKVRKHWPKIVKHIKERALAGNDTAWFDEKDLKKWTYDEKDCLVARLHNHGFRATYSDGLVTVRWYD